MATPSLSLVESLIGAIPVEEGAALVARVGERATITAKTGSIEVGSVALTVEAMDDLIAQVLPPDQLESLQENGTVHFEFTPPVIGGEFAVLAASTPGDRWLEIRRRSTSIATASASGDGSRSRRRSLRPRRPLRSRQWLTTPRWRNCCRASTRRTPRRAVPRAPVLLSGPRSAGASTVIPDSGTGRQLRFRSLGEVAGQGARASRSAPRRAGCGSQRRFINPLEPGFPRGEIGFRSRRSVAARSASRAAVRCGAPTTRHSNPNIPITWRFVSRRRAAWPNRTRSNVHCGELAASQPIGRHALGRPRHRGAVRGGLVRGPALSVDAVCCRRRAATRASQTGAAEARSPEDRRRSGDRCRFRHSGRRSGREAACGETPH